MKSSDRITPKTCPKCGKEYTAPSALSRESNTYICPECGTREALASMGVSIDEQDKIIGTIERFTAEGGESP